MHLRFRLLAALVLAMGMLLGSNAQAEQCVTFAREVSGIGLKGDGWTWWGSAAGHYDRGQKPRSGAVVVFKKHGSMSHGHVAVVERVATVARDRGVPNARVALAWVLSRPGVTAPIVGASKPHHLDDALAALDLKLTPEEVAALEEPYRPHPVLGHT